MTTHHAAVLENKISPVLSQCMWTNTVWTVRNYVRGKVFVCYYISPETRTDLSATDECYRMSQFYEPDLGTEPDNPFARGEDGKLVRRNFWLDMSDQSLTLAMTRGIGMPLRSSEKQAHLIDIRREHLIDEICQEILPPED